MMCPERARTARARLREIVERNPKDFAEAYDDPNPKPENDEPTARIRQGIQEAKANG